MAFAARTSRRGAHKAQRHIIHAGLKRECKVLPILSRERWNRQPYARQIDSLVFSQFAAILDLAHNLLAARREHAQRDLAVAQQNPVAFVHRGRQRAKRRADRFDRAGNVFCRDDQLLPETQPHRALLLQRTRADFRPLQVGENGDGFLISSGGAPDGGDAVRMFLVRAVRKIQPCHVHPGTDQLVHHFRRGTDGAQRADNFGPPQGKSHRHLAPAKSLTTP